MIPQTQTTGIIGLAHEIWLRVMRDREEILTAFIAKHGCGPDDVIQIEQRNADGLRWYVRMKDDLDREAEARAQRIKEKQAAAPAFVITCNRCGSGDIERNDGAMKCDRCGETETF